MTDPTTLEQLHNFVDDLGNTLDTVFPGDIRCGNIILCGMGGSAITADVVADCCSPSSVKPITVVKSPVLPSWVGGETLAIVSSYSGNTAETIEMYRCACDAGCTVVAITSGGVLGQLAESDGRPIMVLPKGLHPRHSIGYMIGYTLAVMRAAGCPDVSDEVRRVLPELRAYRDSLEGEGSMAVELASLYMGHVPVVCSDSGLKSVVLRWKTQFNENSKYVAFCSPIPEFNHCGLGSWLDDHRDNYALTVLVTGVDRASGPVADAMSRLDSAGVPYRRIDMDGSSPMADMLMAVMLGDYTSVRMAEMRGIDPAEVKPVMLMKERLSRRHPVG
ncbi:MAG: hypothetical protein IJ026_07530 [Candidatus Methanomethylophilaceae archaeon]|nr:hypothetical protein [Candidatus Methanomethylophilaceae archaeon]